MASTVAHSRNHSRTGFQTGRVRCSDVAEHPAPVWATPLGRRPEGADVSYPTVSRACTAETIEALRRMSGAVAHGPTEPTSQDEAARSAPVGPRKAYERRLDRSDVSARLRGHLQGTVRVPS